MVMKCGCTNVLLVALWATSANGLINSQAPQQQQCRRLGHGRAIWQRDNFQTSCGHVTATAGTPQQQRTKLQMAKPAEESREEEIRQKVSIVLVCTTPSLPLRAVQPKLRVFMQPTYTCVLLVLATAFPLTP